VSLDFNDLGSAGSAFQTAGPAKENARCVTALKHVRHGYNQAMYVLLE